MTGYTLIEILVVVVIMSIIATFALLLTGDFGSTRKIDGAAENFKHQLIALEEIAILQPRNYRIQITNKGYTILPLTHDRQSTPIFHPWPAGLKINLLTTKDQIVIYGNGIMTPFNLELMAKNGKHRVHIAADASGKVTMNI